MRVSDADRERMIDRLQAGAGAGRLTLDEFADRVDAVYAAKTFGDLEPITADLPAEPATPIAAAVEEFGPKASSVRRKGRWLAPRKVVLRPHMSSVRLDFSKAVLPHREVDIEVDANMSSVHIVLPRDAWADDRIDLTMSSCRNRAPRTGEQSGPGFHVRGELTMSSVKIRRKRRFLWWEF
ncbi:MAG: DUF1707 SHOCT-like domain-containing protein [Stackebrandtia sp.]